MDWIVSMNKNKDGKTVINLTYYTAVMNSSGKKINISNFMNNQKKEFENVFGQGNVNAKMIIREVGSADQLNDFESLIDIQAGSKFPKAEDGSTEGGDAAYGGKFLRLNADVFESDGSLRDKKVAIHEIGHTGGLVHTFDNSKSNVYANGKTVPTEMQTSYNSANDPYYEANFMNYTKNAAQSGSLPPNIEPIRFFNNTVGKARQGQMQAIINNLYNGNLNFNNIPGRKKR